MECIEMTILRVCLAGSLFLMVTHLFIIDQKWFNTFIRVESHSPLLDTGIQIKATYMDDYLISNWKHLIKGSESTVQVNGSTEKVFWWRFFYSMQQKQHYC